MIACGCDIHATDSHGNGLVHDAAARGQLDVLILLKGAGVRFDVLNNEGILIEHDPNSFSLVRSHLLFDSHWIVHTCWFTVLEPNW